MHDNGDGEPRVPGAAVGEEAESGRGLLLVAALADAWGVGERVPGKIVRCEFRVDGAGYGSPCTCGPTADDQALPFAASQLVDQVMAPRRPG